MLIADHNMTEKVSEYARLKVEEKRLGSRLDALGAELIRYLTDNRADCMAAGEHLVTLSRVKSCRIDLTRLKASLGEDTLAPYLKTNEITRLCVK